MRTRKIIECPCKNIFVNIRSEERNTKLPFESPRIKEVVYGTITMKYSFLTTSKIEHKWIIYTCSNCKIDFCASERQEGSNRIILFKYDDNVMKDYYYSQTYGINLRKRDNGKSLKQLSSMSHLTPSNTLNNLNNLNTIDTLNKGSEINHTNEMKEIKVSSSLSTERKQHSSSFLEEENQMIITKIRQRKMKELYEEKERKIREYMKRIEEQYEYEKRIIENEEKDMLLLCTTTPSESEEQQEEEESFFLIDEENPFGYTEGRISKELTKDSPRDELQSPQRYSYERRSTPKTTVITLIESKIKSQMISSRHSVKDTTSDLPSSPSIRIVKSLTEIEREKKEKNAEKEFPESFKEYTLNKKEDDTPVSASYVSAASYSDIYGNF